MTRRIVGLAAALVLTIVGTFLLVAYVRGAEARAVAGEELVNVLVLRRDVPEGTNASELANSTEILEIPAKLLPEGALTELADLDRFEGLVTSTALIEGEELLASRFQAPDASGRGRVAVPSGLLEVSVALDNQRTVGATLQPGDHVAVIASTVWSNFQPGELSAIREVLTDEELRDFLLTDDGGNIIGAPGAALPETTEIFLQKVLVVNVQFEEDNTPAPSDTAVSSARATALAPKGNVLVTLALLPDQVEALVHTQNFASVWLARQEPDDVDHITTFRISRSREVGEVLP